MTDQTPGCGSNSEARKRATTPLDECGYPEGVTHAHVEQCHRAERAAVVREIVSFTEAVENVRRYAQMTLDSISIERQGMAQDVLELLPEAVSRG